MIKIIKNRINRINYSPGSGGQKYNRNSVETQLFMKKKVYACRRFEVNQSNKVTIKWSP